MRSILAVLALAAVAGAQVRVLTSLPAPVLETVRAALLQDQAGLEFRIARRGTRDLFADASRGEAPDADLLVGVDAQVVELFDAAGRLAEPGLALPPGLSPFAVPAGARYLVPWADAYVAVRDPRHHGAGTAPRSLAELAAAPPSARLLLPEPAAAPSLFVEWIRAPLRDGETSDLVFATLTAVDARVQAWLPACEDALPLLAAEPESSFAVLPLSALRGSGPELAFDALRPFTPLLGHALAVTATAADPVAARRLAEVLLAPELAQRLAVEHGLLPGLTARLGGPVPDHVRELVAAAAPLDPDRDHVARWFQRFEAEVRGRGRYSEDLGLWLDLLFGLAFVAAIVWVFRRSQVADG